MKIVTENNKGKIFKISKNKKEELKSFDFRFILNEGLYLLKNVVTAGKVFNGYFLVDNYGSVSALKNKYVKGVFNV